MLFSCILLAYITGFMFTVEQTLLLAETALRTECPELSSHLALERDATIFTAKNEGIRK